MKSVARGIVAVVAAATAYGAVAADLPYRRDPPVYIPPAPIFTWTGLYVGATVGYGFGDYSRDSRALLGNGDGIVGGGTVGYNYQMGHIVFGVEGDISGTGVSSTQNNSILPITGRSSLDAFGTIRGRVGYAMDRTLFYATGGYAGGQISSSLVDGVNGLTFSDSQFHNGFALGAGIEYALTPHITAKAEYLYTSFEDLTAFGAPDQTRVGLSLSTIRAGVNYKF